MIGYTSKILLINRISLKATVVYFHFWLWAPFLQNKCPIALLDGVQFEKYISFKKSNHIFDTFSLNSQNLVNGDLSTNSDSFAGTGITYDTDKKSQAIGRLF